MICIGAFTHALEERDRYPGSFDNQEGSALTDVESLSALAEGPHGLIRQGIETFEAVGKKNKIKTQRSILATGGTDTGGIQRSAGGCRAMTLSCPTRYIHTVTETIHKKDIAACRDLLAAYLETA